MVLQSEVCTCIFMAPSVVSPSLLTVGGTTTPADSDDYNKGVKNVVDTTDNGIQSIPSVVSIPSINLKGLDGSIEERIATIQALSSACREWGFFQVVNHDVKLPIMEEMQRITETFFSLTPEEKMKYVLDTSEIIKPIHYENEGGMEHLRYLIHPIQNYFHLWPENPPNYREVANEYFEEVWKLTLKLMGAISEGLGLESDYIEKLYGKGFQMGGMHHYPPCSDSSSASAVGLAPHKDASAIVLLMQNDVDGLQMLHDDKWITIRYVPGSFVVNVGNCLEVLSNGKYKSAEHQVVRDEERSRFSIGMGYAPALTAMIEPASPLVDEKNEAKFTPIMFKDYMASLKEKK